MELPIVAPAPVVTEHAAIFRDLFDHQGEFRHFQHDLSGLIVLPKKSLAKMARCILESADTTHRSRFLSEAPWREDARNRRRIRFMLQETTPHRQRRRDSRIVLDETLGEPVGSLFDDGDRHDNHGDGTSPLAHNPVTSCSGSGLVRFPLALRLSRRDEELPPWAASVAKHVPDLKMPPAHKARHRLPQQVDSVWLQEPECQARHEPCRTTIALAIDWVEAAIRERVPCGVVVFDAWDLAEDLIPVLARRRKDWISRLHRNRLRETASFRLKDAPGWTLKLPSPHIAVEELVPLIPATADRPLTVREATSWCVTRGVRMPGLGKGRMVVSFEHASLTGRSVVLVTNRVDWSTAKLIGLYGHRWPTDTCDQDRKGPLGFHA